MGLNHADDIDQNITVEDSASFRFNFSARFQANEKLSMGLSYRSEVEHDTRGDAIYTNVPAVLSEAIYNANAKGAVRLPELIWAGVAYRITPKLRNEIDLLYTGWSSFKTLSYKIGNEIGEVAVEKNWKDVLGYRLGMEYDYSDALTLRFGYLFDESPIPNNTIDYGIPSDDRHVVSSGLGYSFGQWTIDAMYTPVMLAGERRIESRPEQGILDSTLESAYVHQLGLSVGYAF